jgi:glycosyltransferase involved in cell wall biosynthesis
MEAMALQRPVISTYVAGIPELVEPGEHGWLASAGDVDGLVEAMRTCIEASPETLDAMGAKARARVLRFHDIDREAKRLADLYQGGANRASQPMEARS